MVSMVSFLAPTQPAEGNALILKVQYRDRRRPAPFFVATWSDICAVILYSDNLDSHQRRRSLACLNDAFERRGGPDRSTHHYQLDDITRLRVVPLVGQIGSAFAVFVESVTTRASIEVVTQRYRLTRREVEVLVLVVAGKTGREIADRLCITPATVSDHTSSLLRKTGVSRRLELVTVMQECAWNSDQTRPSEKPKG